MSSIVVGTPSVQVFIGRDAIVRWVVVLTAYLLKALWVSLSQHMMDDLVLDNRLSYLMMCRIDNKKLLSDMRLGTDRNCLS